MKHIFRVFNGWNDREKRLVFDVENPEKPEANNENKDVPPEAPKDPTKIKEEKVDETKKTVDDVNKDTEQKEGAREKFKNNEPLRQEIQNILKDASPEGARFVEALLERVEKMKDTLSVTDFKNGLQAMVDIGPQFALNYMSIPRDQRDTPEVQQDRATFEAVFNKLDENGKKAFEQVAILLQAQGVNENKDNGAKNSKELTPEARQKLKTSAESALPKPEEAKKLSQGDLDRRIASVMMNFGVSVMVNAETKEMTVVPPTSGWDKFFNTIVGAGMYILSYYSDAKQKFSGLFNKQSATPATTPGTTPESTPESKESKQRIEQEMKTTAKTLEQLKADRLVKRESAKEKIEGKGNVKGLKEQFEKADTDVKSKKDEIETLMKLRAMPNLADDEKAKRDAEVRKAEGDLKKMEEDAAKFKKQLEDAQKDLADAELDLATIEEMLKNPPKKEEEKDKKPPEEPKPENPPNPEERPKAEPSESLGTLMLKETLDDTKDVLRQRIIFVERALSDAQKGVANRTWSETFDSTFKFGGLFGTTVQEGEEMEVESLEKALGNLKNLQTQLNAIDPNGDFKQANSFLEKTRSQLGLPVRLQKYAESYDDFQRMLKDGVDGASEDLGMDWLEINEKLKESEWILNGWELMLNTIDTGASITSSFVPGGNELYMFIRCSGDVIAGTKTPEEAAKEFAFSIIAAKVGGKVLAKIKIDEKVGGWVAKNAAKFFSPKVLEKVSEYAGKTAAGSTLGGTMGATEGVLNGGVDVAKGEKTIGEAAADTAKRTIIGGTVGGVASGSVQGVADAAPIIADKVSKGSAKIKEKIAVIGEGIKKAITPRALEQIPAELSEQTAANVLKRKGLYVTKISPKYDENGKFLGYEYEAMNTRGDEFKDTLWADDIKAPQAPSQSSVPTAKNAPENAPDSKASVSPEKPIQNSAAAEKTETDNKPSQSRATAKPAPVEELPPRTPVELPPIENFSGGKWREGVAVYNAEIQERFNDIVRRFPNDASELSKITDLNIRYVLQGWHNRAYDKISTAANKEMLDLIRLANMRDKLRNMMDRTIETRLGPDPKLLIDGKMFRVKKFYPQDQFGKNIGDVALEAVDGQKLNLKIEEVYDLLENGAGQAAA